MSTRTITVTYRSLDGFRKARRFRTLDGARRFAHGYVGEHPELGSFYAVSFDGVGRVTVTGATLAELFPCSIPEDRGMSAAEFEAHHGRAPEVDDILAAWRRLAD